MFLSSKVEWVKSTTKKVVIKITSCKSTTASWRFLLSAEFQNIISFFLWIDQNTVSMIDLFKLLKSVSQVESTNQVNYFFCAVFVFVWVIFFCLHDACQLTNREIHHKFFYQLTISLQKTGLDSYLYQVMLAFLISSIVAEGVKPRELNKSLTMIKKTVVEERNDFGFLTRNCSNTAVMAPFQFFMAFLSKISLLIVCE